MMSAMGLLATVLLEPRFVFEPAFVFPGERFVVRWEKPPWSEGYTYLLAGYEGNVALWQKEGAIHGVVKFPAPVVNFWIWVARSRDGLVEDIWEVRVPVALSHKPPAPFLHSTQGFRSIKQGNRCVALVPLWDGYGLWVYSGSKELRMAPVTVFSLGARDAPVREREIRKHYVYGGAEHITLLGSVADIARLVLVIEPARISASLTARYDLRGEWWLLGKRYEVHLTSGETMRVEAPLP